MTRILYTEDDAVLAKYCLLSMRHHFPDTVIDHAANGMQAAEFLRNNSYDAIISDFQFPDSQSRPNIGGVEFFRLWAQIAPDTAFYFLSGNIARDIVTALSGYPESRTHKPDDVFMKGAVSPTDVIRHFLTSPPPPRTPDDIAPPARPGEGAKEKPRAGEPRRGLFSWPPKWRL